MSDRGRHLRSTVQVTLIGVMVMLGGMVSPSQAENSNSTRQVLILELPGEKERSAGWDQVAVASMLLRYYGLPALTPDAYQCGVIAAAMQGRDAENCRSSCAGCRFEAQSTETLERLLRRYPKAVVNELGAPPSELHPTTHHEALPLWGVKSQLTKGRPFIVFVYAAGLSRSLVVAGYREFDRKIDLLLVDPTEAGEQQLRELGAIQAENSPGWWLPYDTVVRQVGWQQTVTVSAEGAVTRPAPGNPPTKPPVPAPPTAAPRAVKCCVQSMYGPASCPLIGGPYQVGWACHCQLGGEKRVVTGVVCESK